MTKVLGESHLKKYTDCS